MSTRAPARRAIDPSLLRLLQFRDTGGFAEFEYLLGGGSGEHMHQASDNSSPTGLMAGAEAGAIVAVEVVVEQDEIPPIGILLKFPRSPVDCPPPILVS